MVEHRLPGWEVARQIAPGAAGTHNIEDGVEDAAEGMRTWSAACRQGGEITLDIRPCCVREVAGIPCAHGAQRMTPCRRLALQNTF
jgi:hypothetical protein